MNFCKINRTFLTTLLIIAVMLSLSACGNDTKEPDPTEPETPTTIVSVPEEDDDTQTAFLGDNLYITDVGKYTGAYMEDGSDEMVTNALAIVLKNEAESDLQLARINLEYADFTAMFEVTNLPAGESVVLLEKNRHEYVSDNYLSAKAENVAFFQQPMDLQEDQVEITGVEGAIMIENLTDEVLGEMYIYYKNSSVDLFYGGITYRVKVDSGLKPGRNMTVMTNHYYPDKCTILNVQILPIEE